MPDLIKSTQQAKEVCKLRSLYTYIYFLEHLVSTLKCAITIRASYYCILLWLITVRSQAVASRLVTRHSRILRLFLKWKFDAYVQVNLFQKHSFLNHLIHNMTTDCSLIFDFSTRKIHVQNMLCTKIDFLFWHSKQFMYTTCSELVVQNW